MPSRLLPISLLFLVAAFLPSETVADDRPNVLLLCVDDLRPELNCYGVDYIHSPHIDRLAATGRRFTRHYVQAPTCGASRFALLCGRYGSASNGALFGRSKNIQHPDVATWFRKAGYITVAVGKVSHHPGGLGGPDWNDESIVEMPGAWVRNPLPVGPWQHPRGFMHGLAHGEIRVNAKDMDVFQAEEGYDQIYPDGLTTNTALQELNELAAASDTEPFFLAVGILRPHLPFGAPARYLKRYEGVSLPPVPHPEKPGGETTWHKSGEFMKYNRWGRDPNTDPEFSEEVRRHYAACVSYADAQVGLLLSRLEELGLAEDTIVVLWGDHGWHLGEHAVWGKHTLFEESLRSPLLVRYPGIPAPGEASDALVESIDFFPTVCDLAGVEMPDFVDGRSLRPQLEDPAAKGRPAISYFSGNRSTIRTETHRLIVGPKHVELYDHTSAAGETENVAAGNAELVEELRGVLEGRLR